MKEKETATQNEQQLKDNLSFGITQLDQQNQSYVLEHIGQILERVSAQPLAENSTDVCAVSAPTACRQCPFQRNRPNCYQCNLCCLQV